MDEQYIDELQQAENEFKKKNYFAAFNIFFELAHKNCVQAQYRLAQMYEFARSVEENPQQAFYWYEKAAQNGHTFAQHNLASSYDTGYGVEQNEKQAIFWYEKAAEQGDMLSQSILGFYYFNALKGVQQNVEKAIKYWQLAVNSGDEQAEKHLALVYLEGKYIQQNTQLGMSLLKKSVKKGDNYALLKLGEIWEKGLYGSPKEEKKALELYKLFIQDENNEDKFYHSYKSVLCRIVKMYIEARGTKRNLKQAKKYLSKIYEHSEEYKELKQLLNKMS